MSKKDKDKDKRKKTDGHERSAWMGDLRPSRGESRREAKSAMPPPLSAMPPATEPSRLSSPVPDLGVDVNPHIPPLRPLSFDSASLDDLGEDSLADIAPIGPTEPFGDVDASVDSHAAPPRTARSPSVEQLEQQIRDLEARLDEMIGRGGAPPSSTGRAASAPPPVAPEPVKAAPIEAPPADAPRVPTARELLSPDFYLRQWGRSGLRRRAEEVDEFGFDPKYEARLLPFLDFLYKNYFRVETTGTEHIPEEGRCLVVANHSGGPLPYDGVVLRTAVRREHATHRELRWLAEDFVYHLPFVGTAMNRLGAVRACQENAERLLEGGSLVAVFPEGAKGIGKLFKDRYRLQRFGRGGFIRLCLRTGTPIVPSAIVGAEEASPMLYRIEYLTKTMGIPFLPITPTFPALGPVGLLPAPTKWKIVFGEPIHFDGYGPEAADDEVLVGRLSERVRVTIQALLDRTLSERRSVWFG
ncbi:acyltransferase family protein [Minicystis rosea]|nr:acyltransferase family protein [Minicystis rosea]